MAHRTGGTGKNISAEVAAGRRAACGVERGDSAAGEAREKRIQESVAVWTIHHGPTAMLRPDPARPRARADRDGRMG